MTIFIVYQDKIMFLLKKDAAVQEAIIKSLKQKEIELLKQLEE